MTPNFVCIGVPYFLGQRLDERTEVAAVRSSEFVQDIGAEWVDLMPDDARSPRLHHRRQSRSGGRYCGAS